MLIHFKETRTSTNNLLKVIFLTTLRLSSPLQAMDAPDINDQFLLAAVNGKIDQVKQLLWEGVDVNARNRYDATALMFAAKNGHIDICQLLIERGADVNTKDKFGHTALWLAQDIEVWRLLINYGANVNVPCMGLTLLINATSMSSPLDRCKLLIEKGANVFATDRYGLTALKVTVNRESIAPTQRKELCILLIDAMLRAPMNQAFLRSVPLTLQQRSQINALVASLRNTPIKGLSHDTKRLIIEDVNGSFKRRNFIEAQIMAANDETLKRDLLDYLNSRIKLQMNENPQVKEKPGCQIQ